MNLTQVKERFAGLYGGGGAMSFHSPGRVNLIGEHTDYNGGYVFPCALTLGTYGVARKRDDKIMRLASVNFGVPVEISLDAVVYNTEHEWVNYLLGVVDEFQKLGVGLSGLDLLIAGDVPSNAGLSSSASVELLMSVVLNELSDSKIPMLDLVRLSQRAENRFVGVNCGIMDQFAVGMGQKDRAMLLNCADLDCQYIPVMLEDHSLIIGNTNQPRGLAGSKYNERRAECERAAVALGVKLLGDITPEGFEVNKHKIVDEIALKRATHVIYEIDRTMAAARNLAGGDLEAFGLLMNDSHDSLADLYEVTGFALDALAMAARGQSGVLGSRMTGAGFGGCTVSLVRRDSVGDFIENVGRIYKKKTGINADFYVAGIGDGARRID